MYTLYVDKSVWAWCDKDWWLNITNISHSLQKKKEKRIAQNSNWKIICREKGRDLTQSYDKSPYTDRKSKKQRDNTKTPPKASITHVQRLRTDLGRSVGVSNPIGVVKPVYGITTFPRRTRIRALSPLRRFGQVLSCSPHHLVSHSAMLKERSVQCCRRAKHKEQKVK